jgi:uncharacterized protein YndB with AHSA1/START domain
MMEDTIELTRKIATPPERVFAALTEPAELDRWWTTSSESDARTGGSFDYRWEFEEGAGRDNHRQSGVYDEVVPNQRVAYPWRVESGATNVDVTLSPSGDGTTLRLVHTGWGDGEAMEASARMHEEGWGFFLDNLEAYLERGEDGRGAMGLKTPAASRG